MKTLILGLLFVFVGQLALLVVADSPPASLPSFPISACPTPLDWSQVDNVSTPIYSGFYLSDCSGPAKQQTNVKICYEPTILRVQFDCIDNNINSPYTQCNQNLYTADVVELFIGPASADGSPIHHYTELELSPNSVLFASSVSNPGLTCSGIVGTPLPCANFTYNSVRDDANAQWSGELGIPWGMISQGAGYDTSDIPTSWALNMFRIDTPKGGRKEYSCWSCDNTSPPCFHKPAYFGIMTLQ